MTSDSNCIVLYISRDVFTVPSESIHTPLLFPHFVMLQSVTKMEFVSIFCENSIQNTLDCQSGKAILI